MIEEEILIRLRFIAEGMEQIKTAMNNVTAPVDNMMHKFGVRAHAAWNKLVYLTGGVRKFRMELLSVMFFGYAVNRFLSIFTQKITQTTGLMDMLNAAITFLMLPISFLVYKGLLPLIIMLFGVDTPTRLWIGGLILLLAILFMLLGAFGALGLGLYGISAALTEAMTKGTFLYGVLGLIGKGIEWLINIIKGLSVIWLIVFAIILAAIYARKDEIWNAVKSIVTGVGQIFWGVINIFRALFEMLWGILTGNTELFWKGWHRFFYDGIFEVFRGVINLVLGLAQILINIFLGIPEVVLLACKTVLGIIADIIVSLAEWLKLDILWDFVSILRVFEASFGRTAKTWHEWTGIKLPTLQAGGIIRRPTTAILGERGPEAIIPLAQAGLLGSITYSPTINIQASISDTIDIERLASRISEKGIEDIRRLMIR